jgi:hypothetical protein
MRRREFIAGLGGAAAWPLVVRCDSVPPVVEHTPEDSRHDPY